MQRSLRCFSCAAAPSCRGCSLNDGKGQLQKPRGGPAEVGFPRRVTATCGFSARRGRGPMDAARGVRAAAPQPWLAVLTGSRRRSAYPSNTSRCAHGCRRCAADRRAPLPGYPPPPALAPRGNVAMAAHKAGPTSPGGSLPASTGPCKPVGRWWTGSDRLRTVRQGPRLMLASGWTADVRCATRHGEIAPDSRPSCPRPGNGEVRTKSERVGQSKVAKVDGRSFSLSRSDTQSGGARRMDTAYRGCAFRNAVKGGEHG